ncbi:MAG: hypothetical protein AB7U82_04965 [Blastocatellales bacterium]
MTLKRITVSFLVALLFCLLALVALPALAQTPAPPQSQKEQKELEKKALVLLDVLVGEAMSLKLVENRIFALTTAADLFWKHNEDRARALLREAVNQFMLIEQPAELDDPRALQAMQIRIELRTQLLHSISARDSRMALDFLRASRLPDARKMLGSRPASPDFEQQFEMQLAVRIAENDPRMALQIAEESLKEGVNHQVFEIWTNLMGKDSKAAAKLSGEIISTIKASDMAKNYQSMSVAFSMLQYLRTQMQEAQRSAKDSQPAQSQQPSPQEMQQTFRELLDLIVSAALKVTAAQLMDLREQGPARNLLAQVQMLMPDIEKNLTARAGQVRAKLAQFDKAFYSPPVLTDSFLDDMAGKSPDELVAMASKSQDEFKYMLYRQAATKAAEQGDTARARQIAKDFLPNGGLGDPLIAEIDQAEREQALKQGKLEEARKSVSRLRSSEERALALVELARKAEANKDQKSQRELLKEAGEFLGDQMETRAQVEAQLNLAAASLDINADRGFEILGSAIDRLNVVLSAVVSLTKFDQGGGLFGGMGGAMEGELRLNAGEFGNVTTNLDQQILAFARKDFDRTVALLGRWQVNEVRLAMSLTLAEGILGEKKESRVYMPHGLSERIH